MFTSADIAEITGRHRKVDADQRYTDKLAHRDRGRLLEHIAGMGSRVVDGTGPAYSPTCTCRMCVDFFSRTPPT